MSTYYVTLEQTLTQREKQWVENMFSEFKLTYDFYVNPWGHGEYKLTGEKTDMINYCEHWGDDVNMIID